MRAAIFRRRCSAPAWSIWLDKKDQSGGGVFDLLIHDVDFCVHAFGLPEAVSAIGYEDIAFFRNLFKRHTGVTPTEYRLLATLAENGGRVLSHEQLLNKVWGYEYGEDTGYVKRYIWYLRRKIELDPRKPEHILTERGFGYVFQGD